MKTFIYRPRGVCSRKIELALDDDQKVTLCKIDGGCEGNTQGLCKMIEGMPADEVIERLSGIQCGYRGTSCPDQISIALRKALDEMKSDVSSDDLVTEGIV